VAGVSPVVVFSGVALCAFVGVVIDLVAGELSSSLSAASVLIGGGGWGW